MRHFTDIIGYRFNSRVLPDHPSIGRFDAAFEDQPPAALRASGQNGPMMGPAPATVVRLSTRR